MPIPNFDEKGLLPPGVHDCSLEEIMERFGTFQVTDCRVGLYAQLQAFLEEVRSTRLAVAVIVDGSFVTSKPAPEDIDLSWCSQATTTLVQNYDPLSTMCFRDVGSAGGMALISLLLGRTALSTTNTRNFFNRFAANQKPARAL
ncbi:hypothetical protein HYR99_10015 [Candidatus Poribacteria bacterium]|nr:hypothetical protein [Candidatus Poribacteria bacterium]